MAEFITKIRTESGDLPVDYNSLANLPDAANKVKNSLVIKLDGGTTEGTDLFTFDGSSKKNINLTTSSMYGIIDGSIAGVKEKTTAGSRYAKIADIQCGSYYHRICQSLLVSSRIASVILNITLYSEESDKFTFCEVCYVPLNKEYKTITDNLFAGLVNASSSNKFELWYGQGQYGQSLTITPLSRNLENNTLNFYSYNGTEACSSSKPSFTTNAELFNMMSYEA